MFLFALVTLITLDFSAIKANIFFIVKETGGWLLYVMQCSSLLGAHGK